jgi:hypothetical protein
MLLVLDNMSMIFIGEDEVRALDVFHRRRDAYKPEHQHKVRIYRCQEVTEWA